MFVDASVLVADLTLETDAGALSDRIDEATGLFTSPVALFESVVPVARKSQLPTVRVLDLVQDFLSRTSIAIHPIDFDTARLALDAHARYGKGSAHPARLNLGDCFAYAMAKQHGVKLLYKGDDFAQTDLA